MLVEEELGKAVVLNEKGETIVKLVVKLDENLFIPVVDVTYYEEPNEALHAFVQRLAGRLLN